MSTTSGVFQSGLTAARAVGRASSRSGAVCVAATSKVRSTRPGLPGTSKTFSAAARPVRLGFACPPALAAAPGVRPPARTLAARAAPIVAASTTEMTSLAGNPLIERTSFPAFDAVKAEHVVPAIRSILATLNDEFTALEASATPTWPGLVEPMERMVDKLSIAWGTVNHLKAVKDTEELRQAVEEVQPDLVTLRLRMSQSVPVYQAFKAMKEGDAWAGLTEAQRRMVDSEIRDAELGGVALEGAEKERFNEIQQSLTKLSTSFSNNILDATKAFKRLVTDKAEVEGLPESALGLAAQTAAANGHEGATPEDGPWVFTLDFPSYYPVMTHCANRGLREELYRASITKASSGEIDNTPIIEEILALKREKAGILGYDSHAEVSMASKMATLDRAFSLLEELRSASFDVAVQELEEVKAFAAEQGAPEAADMRHWDVTFWAERMREAKYAITDEELRPYFALETVLDGLFGLCTRIFGVTVEAADGEAPVWHEDVRFFRVCKAGEPVAYFYLDPYSRPAEKRGGAWMDEVMGRSRLLGDGPDAPRLPVAHLVCNQSPPVGDKPSLMTFREVETLFHECGHGLQHMLTQQDEGMVAGIRGVEWDAVELPSQFMENWCYDKKTLMSFAKHYETGEELPTEMYDKLVKARTYRAASMMMRQLHFAITDLELHSSYDGSQGTIYDLEASVAGKTCVMKPLPEDRFLCGFSHIFAGGYSAGYYSYKWAEVLSADAFSAFEEAGLENEEEIVEIGRRFRDTVLGMGGGRAPLDVFVDFRGREPSTEPLLRHSGLVAA